MLSITALRWLMMGSQSEAGLYQVEAIDEGNALGPFASADVEISVRVVPLGVRLHAAADAHVAPARAAQHVRACTRMLPVPTRPNVLGNTGSELSAFGSRQQDGSMHTQGAMVRLAESGCKQGMQGWRTGRTWGPPVACQGLQRRSHCRPGRRCRRCCCLRRQTPSPASEGPPSLQCHRLDRLSQGPNRITDRSFLRILI